MTRSSSNRPDTEHDESACRAQAVSALARREHSRLELERKLAGRGYAPDVVAVTLDWLEATGLLDSRRFSESFVRSRIAKGQGPVRIERELAERGIDAEQAAEALASADEDWGQLARAVRRRRFGAEPPGDFAERARQSRFLQYRGFSMQEIREAVQGDPECE